MVLTGGCYCGSLRYRLASPLGPVVNCHCSFCRCIHGAAFTTVVLIPPGAMTWQPSSDRPATFKTPLGNVRHFCRNCASPIWNLSATARLGAVVVGSLGAEAQPAPWAHVNTESKAPWFSIEDGLPQYSGWPNPEELREMCRRHPGAWVPVTLS